MKPVQTTQFVNSGNFDGESIEFGFDQNSLAHLQSILSDLYSDPYLAVLRELSANGLDAQIANGYTGPIEVSLPSALSPMLKIQDFGVGMSLDDLYKTYTKYGASTKRGTDEQVGMLGIGSKSPLAIADSFSIATVHAGLKVSAVVSKNEQGIGNLQIIDTSPTSDHSGTTITIPTTHNYRENANYLFKFWDANTVLVNGAAPRVIEGFQIDDNTLVTYELDSDYIVMGNIPYPVSFREDGSYYAVGLVGLRNYNRAHAVVRVPIGSVNFAPSRETLNYSNFTLNFLRQLRQDTMAKVAKYAQTQIETLATHAEVIDFVGQWRRFNLNVDLPTTWRGVDIPRVLKIDNGYEWNKISWRKNRRLYATSQIHTEAIYGDNPPIFVTGWDGDGVSSSIKSRMNLWMEANESYDLVVFCNTFKDVDGWFANVKQITIADLKAIKLPKKDRNGSTKTKGSYEVMNDRGYFVETTAIVGDPLFCSMSDANELNKNVLQFGRPVVRLGRNRWAKFQRDYPTAEPLYDFVKAQMATIVWTEDDSIVRTGLCITLRNLNPALLNDPELVKWITLTKIGTTPNLIAASKFEGCGMTVIPQPDYATNPFEDRYKLLRGLYMDYHNQGEMEQHLVLYLNTVYAALESDN